MPYSNLHERMSARPAPVEFDDDGDVSWARTVSADAFARNLRSLPNEPKPGKMLPHSAVSITEDDLRGRNMLITFDQSKRDRLSGSRVCYVHTLDSQALMKFFQVNAVHHKEFPVLPLSIDVVSYDTRGCPVTTSLSITTSTGAAVPSRAQLQGSRGRRWWARYYNQDESELKATADDVITQSDVDTNLLLRDCLWNTGSQAVRLFHYDQDAMSDRWRRGILTMPLMRMCNEQTPATRDQAATTTIPIEFARTDQPVTTLAYLGLHASCPRELVVKPNRASLVMSSADVSTMLHEARQCAGHNTHCIARDSKMEIRLYTCDPRATVTPEASIEVQLRFQWVYVPDCNDQS